MPVMRLRCDRGHVVCPLRCPICKKRFINETAFNTHTAVNHPPTYDCTACLGTPHRPSTLECESTVYTKCGRCGRKFGDAPAGEEHHLIWHPKTPCLLCGGKGFHENPVDQRDLVIRENYPYDNVELTTDTIYAQLQHASALHASLQCGCSHFKTEQNDARNARKEATHNTPSPPSITQADHRITTDEQDGDSGSTSASATSNMFSGNICFTGGSYYNIRGDAQFSSPPSQIPHGLTILYHNISASACHDSRERFPPPRCHPSTCKETLDTIMDYIAQTPPSSKILHLFGSEGTGKSAIAQTIAEYYKSMGTLGACFFLSRESHERNTDKNLIATLAYQLCVNIAGLKPFIVKAVEDDLSTFQKDLDTQIESLIINPMVQANDEGIVHGYPILIIVDGIDECENMKEQHAFLRAISGAMGRYNLPLYFITTSRPEVHIVNWLNQDPIICSTTRYLDLDRNNTHTQRDIEVYLRSEFERIRNTHRMPESFVWPSEASIRTLVSETNLLFRYASKIMAFIDDQNDTPQNRLEDILRASNQSSSGGRS